MQVNKVQNQNQYYFIVPRGNLFATAAKGQLYLKKKSSKNTKHFISMLKL